jgi:uncharacterized protein (TIGR02246 family)
MTLRRFHVCAFALAMTLMSLGCQSASGPEYQAAADAAAIDTLRGQFTTAFNANDPAAVAALHTEDATLLPNHQPKLDGREAIQSWYEAMFKDNSAKIAIATEETQVAGNWAYDRGTVQMSMSPKAGGKPVEESGKYLVILKRQTGGSWRVHRDMDNSNTPMPAPAAGKK